VIQPPPVLVIRADATSEIGTGHLQRCLALASAWTRLGGEVAVCGRCESLELDRLVTRLGGRRWEPPALHPDPTDLERLQLLIAELPPGRAVAVIDGYHFDAAYQASVRRRVPLLVIDDLGCEPQPEADIILNQNIQETVQYQARTGTTLLLGLKYALLRDEFSNWSQWNRPIAGRAVRLLVTFGGSDPAGVTLQVLRALTLTPDFQIRVVVGGASPYLDAVRKTVTATDGATLVVDTPHMAKEMANADLAISGAGSTAWELAFMGLPAALVVLADNQAAVARALDRVGAAVNLGPADQLRQETIATTVKQLAGDAAQRTRMSRTGRALLDGRGADRVAAALQALPR